VNIRSRDGSTRIRIEEHMFQTIFGTWFGFGFGGGFGMGMPVFMMLTLGAHAPLLGIALWLAIIAAFLMTARLVCRALGVRRARQLRKLIRRLHEQVARSAKSPAVRIAVGATAKEDIARDPTGVADEAEDEQLVTRSRTTA
jgi:hypothetical protein